MKKVTVNEILAAQKVLVGTRLNKNQQTTICRLLDQNPEAQTAPELAELRQSVNYGSSYYGNGQL